MPPISLPHQLADGRYTVEGVIGEGGVAVVYRVRHQRLGTQHALKVLTEYNRTVAQRLMAEGRVQAALRHPNVVAVTDILDVNGAPGLILEYVDGPSLEDVLHDNVALTLEQVDALAAGILEGVLAAHDLGVIHRDLKPANVMLQLGRDGVIPKVADFGLVKWVSQDKDFPGITRGGAAMGTPAYMAPEQIHDAKRVDARADVWSLGVMLFEMVAGRPPFPGDDVIHIIGDVAHNERPAVTDLRPDLPQRMVDAIEGALVLDPDARHPSVEALRSVLFDGVEPDLRGAFDARFVERCRTLSSGGEDVRSFLRRSFLADSVSPFADGGAGPGPGDLPPSLAPHSTRDTWVPKDSDTPPGVAGVLPSPPRNAHGAPLPSVAPDAARRTPSPAARSVAPSGGLVIEAGLTAGFLLIAIVGLAVAAWRGGPTTETTPAPLSISAAPVVVIEEAEAEPPPEDDEVLDEAPEAPEDPVAP